MTKPTFGPYQITIVFQEMATLLATPATGWPQFCYEPDRDAEYSQASFFRQAFWDKHDHIQAWPAIHTGVLLKYPQIRIDD